MISESLAASSRRGSRKAEKAAEKAKRLEEQVKLFQTLEQKHRLIFLVDQRQQVLTYLQQLHANGGLWMDSVHISQLDLKRHALRSISANKVLSFYYLSLSLTNLSESVASSNIGTYLQRLLQLLEEFEYCFAGAAMRGVKLVMAKQTNCVHPSSGESGSRGLEAVFYTSSSLSPPQAHKAPLSGASSSSSNSNRTGITSTDAGVEEIRAAYAADVGTNAQTTPLRASLFKFNGVVAYEHLLTPHVPHELCYAACLSGLCNALVIVYSILADDERVWRSTQLFHSVAKMDRRVREIVLEPVIKECGDIAEGHALAAFEAVRAGIPS